MEGIFPGHALAHQLTIQVDAVQCERGDGAAVLIDGTAVHLHHFFVHAGFQIFKGSQTELLCFFRCVDVGQTQLQLLLVAQRQNGVAVDHGDHIRFESLRLRRPSQATQ